MLIQMKLFRKNKCIWLSIILKNATFFFFDILPENPYYWTFYLWIIGFYLEHLFCHFDKKYPLHFISRLRSSLPSSIASGVVSPSTLAPIASKVIHHLLFIFFLLVSLESACPFEVCDQHLKLCIFLFSIFLVACLFLATLQSWIES